MSEPKKTDLSLNLRTIASSWDNFTFSPISQEMMIATAEEIERYYNGMLNWKATAEAKDAAHLQHKRDVASTERTPITLSDEQIDQIAVENGLYRAMTPDDQTCKSMIKRFVNDIFVAANRERNHNSDLYASICLNVGKRVADLAYSSYSGSIPSDFELWHKERYGYFNPQKVASGEYLDVFMVNRFEAWQAAIADRQKPQDEYAAFVAAHRSSVLKENPEASEEMIMWHASRYWNGKPGEMWRARAALAEKGSKK